MMPASDFSIQNWFDSRAEMRTDFLARAGWADARILLVGDDCAFRRYVRLLRPDGTSAILMEAVPDGHAIATPGHNIKDYLRIGVHLRAIGLHAPEVFEADADLGYVLLEDFGDLSFKRALEEGAAPRDALYAHATDILITLRDHGDDFPLILPAYYSSHVHEGRRRVVDWYMPAVLGRKMDDGLAQSFLSVWVGIEKNHPAPPTGILHIDYHFENLMRLADGSCGLLDFQGAMRGPLVYDLANLLEDARVDVPTDLRDAMLNRYLRGLDADARDNFLVWYRILATQFHCRVIGQFIRLAVRDGKTRYLAHIPRVAAYIRAGLQDPVLQPVADWFAANGVDFSVTEGFDPVKIRPFIREDAF